MSVEFKGAEFEPRGNTNRMRSLYLAKLARDGQKRIEKAERDNDTSLLGSLIMDQQAALYEHVQHVLRPEDFDRFMELCDEHGVNDSELYTFTAQMMGLAAERPTGQPTVSSDGPSSTPESSGSRLEQLATVRHPGRPDLVWAATASERMSDAEVTELFPESATA